MPLFRYLLYEVQILLFLTTISYHDTVLVSFDGLTFSKQQNCKTAEPRITMLLSPQNLANYF